MKKESAHKHSEVILPTGTNHLPEAHEQSAAHIIAKHFNCRVEFNAERRGYKAKTADILMNGVEWEIKSPTGSSRSTISNQFMRAKKQSKNIILDLRRTKLTEKHMLAGLHNNYGHNRSIKRIILIRKDNSVCIIK